jgi:hypothetical protein
MAPGTRLSEQVVKVSFMGEFDTGKPAIWLGCQNIE